MTDEQFALTATLALLLLIVSRQPVVTPRSDVRPVDKPVAVSAPVAAQPFAARWAVAQAAPVEPAIKVVRTVPITKQPEPEPVAAPPQQPAPLPKPKPAVVVEDDSDPEPPVRTRRTRTRMAALDICQRHNMRRVVTNGGRSWRCRR